MEREFKKMYKKSILITGGAGFIGSNFVDLILEKEPESQVIVLDKMTYAADENYLTSAKLNENFLLIKNDICNTEIVRDIFQKHNIQNVYHFAAESHVDNSIKNPDTFIQTNINGTFNLIHNAYKEWMTAPNQVKENYKDARFLHVSTDEVYGTLGENDLFKETTPYAPNSPYSASKASSDFIIRSYFHTFGMNVVTTNCSNNYGPNQHDEKLIPTVIRKAINNEPIPIYGNGKNVRDWLYVTDHCEGIFLALKKGRPGETYNIGGRNEKQNLEICHHICDILNQTAPKKNGQNYRDQISFVTDRPGHDFRYAIDASKIEDELGWKANENFESGIKKTVNWYLKKWKVD